MAEHFSKITQAVGKTRILASTAYEICQIAAGQVGGCFKVTSNPWGFSAACLIVEEAGGEVTDFTGGKWDIESRRLVISNERLHRAFLQILGTCGA
jgi:myo-inositol-1(or 4)-monophosphatase